MRLGGFVAIWTSPQYSYLTTKTTHRRRVTRSHSAADQGGECKVSSGVGTEGSRAVSSVRSLLRGVGRVAIWTVLAAARVMDPASGASYPVAYRLDLLKRGRWYVQAVEGASV